MIELPMRIEEMRSVRSLFDMTGKVALVTGAAGGIGRSTAAGFAQNGASVVLMDIPRAEDALKALCEDYRERFGAECSYVTGDISSQDSVDEFVGTTLERYGSLDMVHNNAGIAAWPDNADIACGPWKQMVDINFSGSFYVARTCGRVMKEHGIRGSIVTTASISASVVNAGPGYSATKAGVKHMSAALAIEYAPYGIRFNTVSYGYICSGLHKAAGSEEAMAELYEAFRRKTPMGRMGTLEEVIGPVLYLASDLSSFQTGSDIVVDGGMGMDRLNG